MTYLDEFYSERYELVRKKLKALPRKEADKVAVTLDIGLDTVRRLRYETQNPTGYMPTIKVIGKLDRYFIDAEK